MRRAVRLFVALLIGYAIVVVGGCSLQRKLIYHPNPHRPTPAEAGVPSMKPVSVTTRDGLTLLAWWRPPAGPSAPVILFYHGNAGHLGHHSRKLRTYLDRGWGVLLLAWRGFSGNPGEPTEQGLYADGRAALGFLRAQRIPAAKTVLYGTSLGSGVAVQMASETRFGAVVLEAPYTSMAEAGQIHYPYLPVYWLLNDRFESMSKIDRIGAPLLVLHGKRDRVIPVRLGQGLFDAAREPKTLHLIEGAGHNDLYRFDVGEIVAQFIIKRIGK